MEHAHRLEGVIISALPLSSATQKRFCDRFTQLLGRPVAFDVRVDPSLMGGVMVEIDGKLWDGSLIGQLQEARRLLLS